MSDQQSSPERPDRPTFAEPWQARAFALAVSLTGEPEGEGESESGSESEPDAGDADGKFGYRWSEFQRELVAKIDADDLELDHEAVYDVDAADAASLGGSEEVYYRQWLSALEHLLTSREAVDGATLRERAVEFARGDRDAHEFVDGDPRAHADRLPEGHADGEDHDHGHHAHES